MIVSVSGRWFGSLEAQQPFRDGQVVREEQPTLMGFVPHLGTIVVTCTARLTPTTGSANRRRTYPMMLILGVFDFPDQLGVGVPDLAVTEVSGIDLGEGSLVRRRTTE